MHQHMPSSGHRTSSHSKDKDTRKIDLNSKHKDKNAASYRGATNHVIKSSNERSKHRKAQGPLRGCGNWSEHISSSGKKYFYNNVSEVSQWEKPKDWNDSSAVDLKSRDKTKSSQKSNMKPNRSLQASSSGQSQSSSHTHADADKDYRNRHKDYCDRDYRTKATTGDRDYRDVDYRDVSSVRKGDPKDALQRSVSTDKDYRTSQSVTSTTNCHVPASVATATSGSNGQVLVKTDIYLPSTGEFYDYSSWDGKAKLDQAKGVNGGINCQKTALNSQKLLHDETSSNGKSSAESKLNENAASAFVRKLSNVLTQAATTSNDNKNKTEGGLQSVFQLLLNAAANQKSSTSGERDPQHEAERSASNEAPPAKRPCLESDESRKPQDKSNNSNLAPGEPPPPEFPYLESLRDVFDRTSITHVHGWPAEQFEIQCHRLGDDFHRFIVDHLSELSAQLTNARSDVRASEIRSTLQEQRILYIRQQIKDLERTVNSAGPFT
ncbi:uncharacterized protein LOC143468924 isoform X2 [Clavelina lepadiformis]